MNGTRPYGLPQYESHTTGFTAVNGDVRRTPSHTLAQAAASALTSVDEDTIHVATAFRPGPLHENPSKDAQPQPGKPAERRESHSSAESKRKRSDSQDHSSLRDPVRLDTINTGANGSQSPKRRHIQTIADSAIDLTSPSHDPANPLQRDFASERKSGTPRARESSPVPWRVQLEQPPRPTAETEASLAESVLKFQQNRQAEENRQAQSQSGSIEQAGSPEDDADDDDLDGHDQGDGVTQGDNGDPKKRKRNFSNRTKTGCHTCRSRKKKCDEEKPRCKNCERGGFECLGYGPKQPGMRGQLPGRGVVPLQAKGNEGGHTMFYPPQPPPFSQPPTFPQPPHNHPDDSRHYRNWSQPYAGQDHGRRPLEAAQSQRPGSQGGRNDWPRSQWSPHGQPVPPIQPALAPGQPALAPPPPSPWSPEHVSHPPHFLQPSQPQHRPPPPPQAQCPQPPPPQGQHSQPPHPPFSSYTGPYPPPERQPAVPVQPPVQHADPYNPMRYPHQTAPPAAGNSRERVGNRNSLSSLPPIALPGTSPTDKEKMLIGKPYHHYLDQTLVRDRKECLKLLAQYNNAPEQRPKYNGHDRAFIFEKILKPSWRLLVQPPQEDTKRPGHYWDPHRPGHHLATPDGGPQGRVGTETIVEEPFWCDFGYGLNIGQKGTVERECYFQDAGGIHIGDGVIIQARVTLLTLATPTAHAERGGSKGLYKAGMITIGDNVFIGHGSIVYPCVTIGKNAYVWPGSVVTQDVKDNSEVAGNPAQKVHFSVDLPAQEESGVKRMEKREKDRKKERDEMKWPEIPKNLDPKLYPQPSYPTPSEHGLRY